jgi:hypothetical protein
MDQIYGLPFRDWLELKSKPGIDSQEIASADSELESGSGDSVPKHRTARGR